MGVRTATQYHQMWRALLPTGSAWALTPAHPLYQLLLAWAKLPAELDTASNMLLEGLAGGDLERWESVAGLPTPTASEQSDEVRRDALLARLLLEGDLSPGALVTMGSYWGFELSPGTRLPATCTDACDAWLGGEEAGLDCTGECTAPIVDWGWRFCIEVEINSPVELTVASCESPCTIPLATWADEWLESNVRNALAAHVWARFLYTNVEESQPVSLLYEDGWELYSNEGEAALVTGNMTLSIPADVIAPFDGLSGYLGPYAVYPVQGANHFRMRINIHLGAPSDTTNACGLFLETETGRLGVRVFGNGTVALVWLHSNEIIASAAGPLSLTGDGWVWLSWEAGTATAGYGVESSPIMLGEVTGVPEPSYLGLWAEKHAETETEQYTSILPVERI